ncbi:ester cyclase [Candidatus Bipolaricaulota bacterium]|nr:ester cyclase [Candidatus Bipolaricaulota bacterium]
MTREHAIRLVEEDIDAINRGDLDRLCACYTDDVVFVDISDVGSPVTGMEAFRASMQALLDTFPDMQARLEHVIAEPSGTRVVAQYELTGTMRGAMGEIPPTGKRFSIPAASIYEMRGTRFAKETLYWDTNAMFGQLDIH